MKSALLWYSTNIKHTIRERMFSIRRRVDNVQNQQLCLSSFYILLFLVEDEPSAVSDCCLLSCRSFFTSNSTWWAGFGHREEQLSTLLSVPSFIISIYILQTVILTVGQMRPVSAQYGKMELEAIIKVKSILCYLICLRLKGEYEYQDFRSFSIKVDT